MAALHQSLYWSHGLCPWAAWAGPRLRPRWATSSGRAWPIFVPRMALLFFLTSFAQAAKKSRFFERPAALRRLKRVSAAFLVLAAVLTAAETASAAV